MNVYDFGDGIVRTHLTWDDVQEKVKEIWGEKAIIGPNKKATSIGDGRGFMSKLCLVDPDWQEIIEAPKTFILKISSSIAITEANDKMNDKMIMPPEEMKKMEAVREQIRLSFIAFSNSVRKMHNTECHMYNLMYKYGITSHHPKVFGAVPFCEKNQVKGYLIMEYIEGALSLNIYDNVSVEDIKQALRAIAALEVASLKFSEEDIESLKENHFAEIYGNLFTPETIGAMFTVLRQFAGHRVGEKINQVEKSIKEIVDLDDMIHMGDRLGMKKVLVHGDCWSTNFLWTKKESNDGLNLAAIVDYQTAHMGMPAFDLFRVMGACLSGKDRQTHWNELIELFYDYLLEGLNGAAAPYTLNQLKENMRRYTPLGGFGLVFMIGPIYQLNQMNPDEKQKAKVEEKVLEKMECLLDDILREHATNMKNKEDEKE